MKLVVRLILTLILLAVPLLAQGQSSLYKKYEHVKEVEVYYMKDYKEFSGHKMDATLVRYSQKDRVRCRQLHAQLMNEAVGLTSFRMTQSRQLISSYWYAKGRIMIINYKPSLCQIECMLLEGDLSAAEMKEFLTALSKQNSEIVNSD